MLFIVRKIVQASGHSLAGLVAATRHELAIRIELGLLTCAIVVALAGPFSLLQGMLLVVSVAAIVVAELANSAIERAIDLCTTERHPLAKEGKDMASAAVMLSCLIAVMVWAVVLWDTL